MNLIAYSLMTRIRSRTINPPFDEPSDTDNDWKAANTIDSTVCRSSHTRNSKGRVRFSFGGDIGATGSGTTGPGTTLDRLIGVSCEIGYFFRAVPL